jgi:hypothetical protein
MKKPDFALQVKAKAMVLSFRREKSTIAIESFLQWQSWTCPRLQFARLRQMADGEGREASPDEFLQLTVLVDFWEGGINDN